MVGMTKNMASAALTGVKSVTKLRPPLLQTNSGVSMTVNVVTAPLTGLKSVTKLRPPLLQTMSV